MRGLACLAVAFVVAPELFAQVLTTAAAAANAQWTAGMDDDVGKAAATSSSDLPAADFAGMRHV